MATSSKKGFNEVILGSYVDQADGTTAEQVTIVAGAGSGGTSSNFGSSFPAAGTAAGFNSSTSTMEPGNLDASGNLLVNLAVNPLVTSPLVGQAKIATTGTAVRLNGGTSQALTNGIIISATSGNSAAISVGGSAVNNTQDGTGNGYVLVAGASISFAIANTNELYINGTSGDHVSWAAS